MGAAAVELLRDSVGLAGPAWRERTIPLAPYGLQSVRLCVEIDGGAPGPDKRERFAYWEQPQIAIRGMTGVAEGEDDGDAAAPQDLSPEELEVRRRHLKALGYVG